MNWTRICPWLWLFVNSPNTICYQLKFSARQLPPNWPPRSSGLTHIVEIAEPFEFGQLLVIVGSMPQNIGLLVGRKLMRGIRRVRNQLTIDLKEIWKKKRLKKKPYRLAAAQNSFELRTRTDNTLDSSAL